MSESEETTIELVRRAVAGDGAALEEALSVHRDRLKRMVRLRLNRQLQSRVDESDVVQDVLLEASNRLREYVENPSAPFYLWLRFLAGRKLTDLHRRHLAAEKRDAALEVSLHRGAYPTANSASLAAQLLGRISSPSQAAMRAELKIRVQEALNELNPLDREILALRHFEQLSNTEAATILGVGRSTASSRYLRALKKMKDLLAEDAGLLAD